MSHTPTPQGQPRFTASGLTINQNGPVSFGPIAFIYGSGVGGITRGERDAVFIANCLNAHDDLVAALIEVRDSGVLENAPGITKMVSAALAKAEGK